MNMGHDLCVMSFEDGPFRVCSLVCYAISYVTESVDELLKCNGTVISYVAWKLGMIN